MVEPQVRALTFWWTPPCSPSLDLFFGLSDCPFSCWFARFDFSLRTFGIRRLGESERAAAQRVLTQDTSLGPPPDIEFLNRLASTVPLSAKDARCVPCFDVSQTLDCAIIAGGARCQFLAQALTGQRLRNIRQNFLHRHTHDRVLAHIDFAIYSKSKCFVSRASRGFLL